MSDSSPVFKYWNTEILFSLTNYFYCALFLNAKLLSVKLNISCTDVSHISSGSKAIICSGKVFNVKRLQEVLRFIHDSLSVKKQRTAKLDRLDLITEWEIKLNWTEQQLNLSREL